MAEIETSLMTHMLSQSTVTNYVGQRIREIEKNQGDVEPYILIVPTSNPRGPFTRTAYGGVARLTVIVYGKTRASARTIGGAVLAIYQQFSGTLDEHTVEQTEVTTARTMAGDERFIIDLIFHYH